MSKDFSRYLGLLRVKWPLVVTAAITAGLAAISVIIGRSDPVVLPGALWLVITVMMLSIAQFLVWRDSEAVPATPEHKNQIRGVARELRKQATSSSWSVAPVYEDGRTRLPALQTAFRAHHPSEATEIDRWDASLAHFRECLAELGAQIERQTAARFPADRGWHPDRIAAQAYDRRMDLLSDPERWAHDCFKNHGPEKEVLNLTEISYWGGDSKPVSEWARAFFASSTATTLLDAKRELEALRATASRSLEPLVELDGVPLRREPDCPVCSLQGR